MMKKREYLHSYTHQDQYFDLTEEYYNLLDRYTYHRSDINKEEFADIKNNLRKIIEKEPNYFDPYLLMFDIYRFEDKYVWADKILDKAYQRALTLIKDKKGKWPDVMEWGWLENRPLIRTLMEKAEQLWHRGSTDKTSWEEAYSIYDKLLRANPDDNVGARYHLLAMLERTTFGTYYNRFIEWNDYAGEVYKPEMEDWFREYLPKHKELAWWVKYAEEKEWLS